MVRIARIATSILVLVSIGASVSANAQDEQRIEGIPVKVIQEQFGFGTRFVFLRVERQFYSKENLERFWRYYCEKYPDKKIKLDIRVFVERTSLDPKAEAALSYDANFNRQGEGAAAGGGDNEFYSYRPDPDKPDETVNVQLKGHYPFLRDTYSGEPGFDLVLAARKGDVARIRKFLDDGGDINIRNHKGETALIGACSAGNVEIAKLLLLKGADPNLKDQEGDTALAWAAMTHSTSSSEKSQSPAGNIEIVRLLLDHSADVNGQSGGSPALVVAAEYGNNDIVKLLLEKGTDINVKNWAGISALSRAIYDGHLDTVEILLAKGADIESRDGSGETPIFYALGRSLKLTRDLLRRGANANARNNALATPLMRANNAEVALALLDGGADLEARDESGATALMYAVESRNLDMIRLLLERHAEVNARTKNGESALAIAKKYSNNRAIIELLTKFGANE